MKTKLLSLYSKCTLLLMHLWTVCSAFTRLDLQGKDDPSNFVLAYQKYQFCICCNLVRLLKLLKEKTVLGPGTIPVGRSATRAPFALGFNRTFAAGSVSVIIQRLLNKKKKHTQKMCGYTLVLWCIGAATE